MEQRNFHQLVIKWFVIVTLFSLSIFVEKLYAFRVYLYNSHPQPVRLEVYNAHHCKCLTKVLEPQSPSFIDVGPVLTVCNEPINKIDIYGLPSRPVCGKKEPNGASHCGGARFSTDKEVYLGTIQGKNILYNPDIVI